ncbi:L,D-transpeptidase [Nocardia cyriacigeorgica]|nr:L,D-transpeptidase [Nocardia cyriacigeorgica]
MMRSNRFRSWSARFGVLLGAVSAGFLFAAPAQTEPLFPGGPDVPGVPAIIPTTAPCAPEARACLRLSTNEAWLIDNGRVVFGPTPISHGMPGYETPPGVFDVDFKRPFHWSTMHHAPMRWAVFFNNDIAFHVGPVEHTSHGCVRMTEAGAHRFFEYLNVGDRVDVVR